MRDWGKFVHLLEYMSIPQSLAGSGFGGCHAHRGASRSSKEMLGIATTKHQTIGLVMRGRGKFVRFLEYVSIPLSLVGSGFGGRNGRCDTSRSSKEMSGIATENRTPRPWRCQIGVRSTT